MSGQDWNVRLARGSAVVARHGGVVLIADPAGGAQEDFLAGVLEACRAAAREHPDAPGRRLVRKVAGLVSQHDVDDVPDFGLLASLGEDVAVLLVGEVELEISSPQGSEVVSGRDVSTWVDRIVRAPFDVLALTAEGAGELDPRSDLGSGTVTAGGVAVSPAGAPAAQGGSAPPARAPEPRAAEPAPEPPPPPRAAEPAPEPPPPPRAAEPAPPPQPVAAAVLDQPTTASPAPEVDLPAPDAPLQRTAPPQAAPVRSTAGAFESFSLDPVEEPADPLPTAAGKDVAADDEPEIDGIMCSRRHFNDPATVYCSACGISMVHQTHNLVKGKRPPLGVVVFDDGSVVPLSRDYVLGREPEAAPQVLDGSATPLQIEDEELKVSRVHARIQLRGWDVRVIDAGSSNGTFVLKKGQTEWTKLVPEEPVTITPGTRVAVGGRTMEYESHHKV